MDLTPTSTLSAADARDAREQMCGHHAGLSCMAPNTVAWGPLHCISIHCLRRVYRCLSDAVPPLHFVVTKEVWGACGLRGMLAGSLTWYDKFSTTHPHIHTRYDLVRRTCTMVRYQSKADSPSHHLATAGRVFVAVATACDVAAARCDVGGGRRLLRER